MAEFQSFHGLRPPDNVDPRVAEAFSRFRQSTSDEVLQLKTAIRVGWEAHRIGQSGAQALSFTLFRRRFLALLPDGLTDGSQVAARGG